MKRWITLCTLLVLIQAGLTLWTNWNADGQKGTVAKGPLIAQVPSDIDELLLESDGTALRIKKVDDLWQLPDSLNFPADSIRIQGLVEKITQLKREWPEASTAEAATRFKVSKDYFAHRLSLLGQGKTLQVLYFGASPGVRKLYLRRAGDAEIHSMEITNHDLSIKPEDWIDTTVLHLKKEQLVDVQLPKIHLKRTPEGLLPADLQQGEGVNTTKLNGLVNRLTGLSISAILGTESLPEYGLEKPAFSYRVTLKDGNNITYSFAAKAPVQTSDDQSPPQENKYILKVSSLNQLVEVDGWQVDSLKKVQRAELVEHTVVPEKEQDVPEVSPQ